MPPVDWLWHVLWSDGHLIDPRLMGRQTTCVIGPAASRFIHTCACSLVGVRPSSMMLQPHRDASGGGNGGGGEGAGGWFGGGVGAVSYTHLRAHETLMNL
eukprot:6444743-Prymnesium_polylepis.2